jgi:subtilase family serine protease
MPGHAHKTLPFFAVASLLIVFLGFVTSGNVFAKTTPQQKHYTLRTFVKHYFVPVCGSVSQKKARCNAHVITNANKVPQASTVAPQSALTPQQLHSAYSLPCSPGGFVGQTCTTPTTFGPTIALIDAYYTSTIQNDLNTFDKQYSLPVCNQENGCLQIVNENGGANVTATSNSSWSLEESLDVQTAHAICQTCKILLVQANSSSFSDLGTGVATAAKLGAIAISNSYGASEFSGETGYDSFYTHPGVGVFASAGDSGYGTEYPAASQGVIGVGGTTLSIYTDNSYAGETVWPDTGSGCSFYESANAFQQSVPNWSQSGCGGFKAVSDVAMDADPNTGVDVYDSTRYENYTGWWQVGGTSLSSVIAASVFAMAYTPTDSSIKYIVQLLYQNNTPLNFHDVLSGSNGSCGTIMCNGATGYDGPTGLGSLLGIGGFGGTILAPTNPAPTLTPGPSSTPILTPAPSSTPTVTPIPPTATQTPVPALGFSNVTATILPTQATVSWSTVVSGTTTSALGTTQFDYGTNANNLTASSPYNSALTTTHSQIITNLRTNTIYYVKFLSNNSLGASYSSGIYYFRTQR